MIILKRIQCVCFKAKRGPITSGMNLSILMSHNKNRTANTRRCYAPKQHSPPSVYLWQLGQSRLQRKVLSFPQPSFPAGLGSVLFHSMTVQCKMELLHNTAILTESIRRKLKDINLSHINIQCKIIKRLCNQETVYSSGYKGSKAPSPHPLPSPKQSQSRNSDIQGMCRWLRAMKQNTWNTQWMWYCKSS